MVFHTPQCEVTDRAVSYCCSSLNGLPEQLMPLAVQNFVRCLREELKTTDTYLYRKVLDNLASCMEDFSLGMMKSNILFSVLTCSALFCFLVQNLIMTFTSLCKKGFFWLVFAIQ